MGKDMDRQFPEDHNSQQPHENSPHEEPEKAEQHLQRSGCLHHRKINMSENVTASENSHMMLENGNSFHQNDSNSHIQTLDSEG